MIRTIKQTLTAGQTLELNYAATSFRLLETSGPVTVKFYHNGAETGDADDMEAGFSADGQSYDKVTVYSASAQSVKFSLSDAGMKYDRFAGSVAVTNTAGAFTSTEKTVANASAQLLAANPARRVLMIQNKDAAGNIYLNLAGAAAVAGQGVKITPGSSLILDVFAPTGAIFAIGDIASNANITVVEG